MREKKIEEFVYKEELNDIKEKKIKEEKETKNVLKKDIYKDSFLKKCIICSKEKLSEQDKNSFLNRDYLTVKTKEEVILYRVASGTDAKYKGRFASPTRPFDRLSAKTDLALAYPYRNRMEIVEEIKVPKGEILQLGYVAPKTTNGADVNMLSKEYGNILQGMEMQVILPINWYEMIGWEIIRSYPLESRSSYRKWEDKIKSIEKNNH